MGPVTREPVSKAVPLPEHQRWQSMLAWAATGEALRYQTDTADAEKDSTRPECVSPAVQTGAGSAPSPKDTLTP